MLNLHKKFIDRLKQTTRKGPKEQDFKKANEHEVKCGQLTQCYWRKKLLLWSKRYSKTTTPTTTCNHLHLFF